MGTNRITKWAALFVGTLVVTVCAGGGVADVAGPDSTVAGDSGVAEAEARVEAFRQAPTDVGVSVALSAQPTGKSIYVMQCPSPICEEYGDSVQAAAEQLGMVVTRIDMGTSPDEIARAWDRAVTDMPDAVAGCCYPSVLFQEQLAALHAAGVPYVTNGTADCDENRDPCPDGAEGVTLNLFGRLDAITFGEVLADFVIADSDGNANVGFFHIPDFSFHAPELEAFEAELSRLCSSCRFDAKVTKITDVGTALPGQVVSYLQANPDINYLVMGYGDMVIGVPEALDEAGLSDRVQILSAAGSASNYAYLRTGDQVADMAYPNQLAGYRTVDAIARVLAGDEITDAVAALPQMLLEPATIDFDPSSSWPGVAGYEAIFAELWGL